MSTRTAMRTWRLLPELLALCGLAACHIHFDGSYEEREPTTRGPDASGAPPDGQADVPVRPIDAAEPDAPTWSGDVLAASSCRPRRIRPVNVNHFESGTTAPSCELDQNGVLTMKYKTEDCPADQPHRSCVFTQNEDLADFQRGRGLLEISYCVEGPLYEDVNLWYEGQLGFNPPLRFLRLHTADDPAPAACRIRFLSASDSCLNYNKVCRGGCVEGALPDAGPDGASSVVDARDEGDAELPPPVCGSLARSKLRITAEWCLCGDGGCVRPLKAEVRLLSLIYHPDDCLCSADADCPAGTFCRKDAVSAEAACWNTQSGCRGLCKP